MIAARRRLLTGIAGVLVTSEAARGEPDLGWAAAFIRRSGSELSSIVAKADSTEARRALLQLFIDRVVDVDAVARFCLGRFWRQATAKQQQDYLHLFHSVLMKAVLGRVGDYEHNEVRVTVERPEMRDGNVQVPTVVERTGNPPARVIWVVSPDADNPRIIDLLAEGTSLRLTVRGDYSAFLSRHDNDIGTLIDALRQQACDGCTSTKPGGR
jgi:phospholipid transport system substrate-binding protein